MGDPDGSPISSRREVIGVGLVMLLLALLTIPFLGREGFWFDEAFSADVARSWSGLFHFFATYENNMAFYYVLLRTWMIFGNSDAWLRLLSVIFALLTIPVFHLLARRLFDARTALIGDALLVSNHFFLRYASEVRSYSLLVFLTTLATLLFVIGMQRPRYGIWIGYAAVVAAAVYTHYFGVMIIGVHAMALMWRQRPSVPWRQVGAAAAVLVLLLLPLFVFRPPASSGEVDWIPRPNFGSLCFFAFDFSGGRTSAAIAAAFFGFLVVLVALGRISLSSHKIWFLQMSVAWLAAPIAVAFVFSLWVKPVFISRYLIECVPALALILALAVSRLRDWAAAATMAVFFILMFRQGVREEFTHGASWREAAHYITSNTSGDDAVICYPYFTATSLAYYLQRDKAPKNEMPLNIASGPYLPGGGGRDPDPAMNVIDNLAAGHTHVWLVTTPVHSEGLNRGWSPEIKAALSTHLQGKKLIHFNDRDGQSIDVFCFERRSGGLR